jgi:hypothetical protein
VGLRVVSVIVSVVVNDQSLFVFAELAAVTVLKNRDCNQLLYNVQELSPVTVLKNRDW